MKTSGHRRGFLKRLAAAGAAASIGDRSFLVGLPFVSAADLQPLPGVVPLKPEIEPLVRLLEDTPRCSIAGGSAPRVRSGLAVPRFVGVGALGWCAKRQPRPSVGFKFHAVLVVNAVHSGRDRCARDGTLVAALLGLGLLQGLASTRRAGRRLDDAAGRRSGGPPADEATPAFVAGDGSLGRGGG